MRQFVECRLILSIANLGRYISDSVMGLDAPRRSANSKRVSRVGQMFAMDDPLSFDGSILARSCLEVDGRCDPVGPLLRAGPRSRDVSKK